MQKPVENNLRTLLKNSGNSDVDLEVNIDIDTKAIAYGIICSLYGRGDLSERELDKAVQKLDRLVERDRKNRKSNESHLRVSRPKIYDFPDMERRRRF
ncbi:hypothetical protein [Virgibacillus senegalensis]|uniref:hypothetical protein n=1 Tax=Virgibacillus senegalensis TaxID=1499679 RepID=UPI00069FADAA|nr:hypothetical protein [Virgibacillus senegalensis]